MDGIKTIKVDEGEEYKCPVTREWGFTIVYCEDMALGRGCRYKELCPPYNHNKGRKVIGEELFKL